jgi:hypothetical protein
LIFLSEFPFVHELCLAQLRAQMSSNTLVGPVGKLRKNTMEVLLSSTLEQKYSGLEVMYPWIMGIMEPYFLVPDQPHFDELKVIIRNLFATVGLTMPKEGEYYPAPDMAG